jgi:hypothetical protein
VAVGQGFFSVVIFYTVVETSADTQFDLFGCRQTRKSYRQLIFKLNGLHILFLKTKSSVLL